MVPTGDLSRGREPTLVGSSGRVQNAGGGEPASTTPAGNEAPDARDSSPKANRRSQASPARQSTPRRVHGDRENPSPARIGAIKTPPNRSPLKTHFSRR